MLNVTKRTLIICLLFSNFVVFPKWLLPASTLPLENSDYEKVENLKNNDFALGIKLIPNHSNKAVLIEFESDYPMCGFMLVGEKQKFYNFKPIDRQEKKIYLDRNLTELPKILLPTLIEAKNLKVGDKLKGTGNTNLIITRVENIKLNEKSCFHTILKNGGYTIFEKDHEKTLYLGYPNFASSNLMRNLSLASTSIGGGLAGATTAALLIRKGSFKNFYSDFKKIAFASASTLFITLITLHILSRKYPEKIGRFLVNHRDAAEFFAFHGIYPKATTDMLPNTSELIIANLSSIIDEKLKSKNNFKLNLAKIDFVEEDHSINNDTGSQITQNKSLCEEILYGEDGNPIRDENGNIARLFIEKYEGINYEGINND